MTQNNHSTPTSAPERNDLDLDPYHFTWDRKRPMRLFTEFTGSRALFWAMMVTGLVLITAGMSAWMYRSVTAQTIAVILTMLLVIEIVLMVVYTPNQRSDPPTMKRKKRRR